MWHPMVYFLVFIQQLWASTEQTGQDSHIKGPPDHTFFKEIHDQPGNFFALQIMSGLLTMLWGVLWAGCEIWL